MRGTADAKGGRKMCLRKIFLVIIVVFFLLGTSIIIGTNSAYANDIYACSNGGSDFYVIEESISINSENSFSCTTKQIVSGVWKNSGQWRFYENNGTWRYDLLYEGIAKGAGRPLSENPVAKSIFGICSQYR